MSVTGARSTLLVALPLFLGACSLDAFRYLRTANPPNPFPAHKIAVCPLINQSAEPRDPLADGEALASELATFPGFEVIWPRQWNPSLPEGQLELQPLLGQARAAGAEALLIAVTTESSSYPPPRLGLAMALYPTTRLDRLPVPYEELMEAGKPFASALPQPTDPWMGAFGTVYDARDKGVLDRLHRWGRQRSQSEASFDWKRGLYSREEFLRFCLNETLRQLCKNGRDRWSKNPADYSPKILESTPPPSILTPSSKVFLALR
jgi:hypothetical protein